MASTSSGRSEPRIKVMEKDLTCGICYYPLREPKELECRPSPHIFCLDCLHEWAGIEPIVECPECRYITIVPLEGLGNLKTNIRLKSMVENGERVEKEKGVPLCPHHEGEKQHFFCVTCSVMVCHNCLVLQHPMSGHDIEELKDVAKTIKEVKAKRAEEAEDYATKLNRMKRKSQAGKKRGNYDNDIEKCARDTVTDQQVKRSKQQATVGVKYQQPMAILKRQQHHTHRTNGTLTPYTCLRNVRTASQNSDSTAGHNFMKHHESWFSPVFVGGDRKCDLKLFHEFGAFQLAVGVAATHSSLLAVVDYKLGEIIIYHNVNGAFKHQFRLGSSFDYPDGKITKPLKVAATSGGKLLVAHSGRIAKIFTSSGGYEKTLTDVGDRITTTPDDLIVTGSSTGVITVHQSNGELITIHTVRCELMANIASNGKQIAFTTGSKGNSIHAIDFVTGQTVWAVEMIMPLGICYEPKTNTLLVAGGSRTAGQYVIEQYCSATGHWISRVASGLYNPLSMTVTQDSKLVVADCKTVKIYDIQSQ